MSAVREIAYAEPMFRTTKGALAFAYNFSHGAVKKPFLASMVGVSRPGRGLGGLDGAAQAGMIKAEVDKVGDPGRWIVAARFVPQKSPCSCGSACCVGFKLNPEWAGYVDWLTKHVHHLAKLGTFSHYHLRRALVVRYFGGEVSLKDVAAKCGINRDTASAHNKAVVEYLEAEERKAYHQLDGELHAQGLIGG